MSSKLKHLPKLKYLPGKRIWFCNNPKNPFGPNKADSFAIVHHSFIGKDGEERVVVESTDQTVRYKLLHWHQIHDSKQGKSNFDKLMEDPEFKVAYSRKIAVAAGICYEDGSLTPKYGGKRQTIKRGGTGSNTYTQVGEHKFYDTDDIQ